MRRRSRRGAVRTSTSDDVHRLIRAINRNAQSVHVQCIVAPHKLANTRTSCARLGYLPTILCCPMMGLSQYRLPIMDALTGSAHDGEPCGGDAHLGFEHATRHPQPRACIPTPNHPTKNPKPYQSTKPLSDQVSEGYQ